MADPMDDHWLQQEFRIFQIVDGTLRRPQPVVYPEHRTNESAEEEIRLNGRYGGEYTILPIYRSRSKEET